MIFFRGLQAAACAPIEGFDNPGPESTRQNGCEGLAYSNSGALEIIKGAAAQSVFTPIYIL